MRKQIMTWVLTVGTIVISVNISPSYSTDPINLPKLLILVPVSFFSFGFLLSHLEVFSNKLLRYFLLLIALFIAQSLISLFFSGSPFLQQFFGAQGRNTGFLAYLSFVLIFLASILLSDNSSRKKIAYALLTTGGASVIYGLIQISGNDPIGWRNPYSPVIAFLGNPNFSSSFIAISSTVLMVVFLSNIRNIFLWIIVPAAFAVIGFVIYKTGSQQGFLVTALANALVILVYLLKNEKVKKIYTAAFASLAVIAGTVAVFGILQIGPLSELLYKTSVRQRGYYWNAAFEMMASRPFTGIGLDSFGDWYFEMRSADAALNSLTVQSNAAHNVFLDIGSTGGYILFILYLIIVFSIFYLGVKNILRMEKFDPFYTAIFASWVGYQAQSVISINQIGLAIWGWVLGGLIVGGYIETSNKIELKTKSASINQRFLILPATLGVIGLIFSYLPYRADHEFRKASTLRDGVAVMNSLQVFPKDTGRMLMAANIFLQSNLPDQAIAIAREITVMNPRDYNAWLLLVEKLPKDSEERINALKNLNGLNPRDIRAQ